MGKPALLKTIKNLERTITVLSEQIQNDKSTASDKVKGLAQLANVYHKLLDLRETQKIPFAYR